MKLIVLLALLGGVTASCTKENVTESPCIVASTRSVTYVVDGRQYYADPQTEEEWSEFLDRMLALAEEGHSVQFWRNGVRTSSSKEKIVYTTTSQSDAKAWCDQKAHEGYTVSMTYGEFYKLND